MSAKDDPSPQSAFVEKRSGVKSFDRDMKAMRKDHENIAKGLTSDAKSATIGALSGKTDPDKHYEAAVKHEAASDAWKRVGGLEGASDKSKDKANQAVAYHDKSAANHRENMTSLENMHKQGGTFKSRYDGYESRAGGGDQARDEHGRFASK